MIKNIIFDMGNVLLRFDREVFMDAAGVLPEDRELLMNEVYVSLEWARMDRGSMTEEEAAESICRRLPERLHEKVHRLVDDWDRPVLPVTGMEALLAELREKGYGIYLLSNASLRMHQYWERIPGYQYFDGTLVSADEKLVKPQFEIYRRLFEKFSLRPEECCFVDDSPMNIEAGCCCGMPGIVFHGSSEELRGKMREMGIKI